MCRRLPAGVCACACACAHVLVYAYACECLCVSLSLSLCGNRMNATRSCQCKTSWRSCRLCWPGVSVTRDPRKRREAAAEASTSVAPDPMGAETDVSFPARDSVHPGRRMKVYCRLGSHSLALLSDIMTVTCLKEGPCGEQNRPGWEGQQAQLRFPGISLCGRGAGLGPPVVPPRLVEQALSHTQRSGLGDSESRPCWAWGELLHSLLCYCVNMDPFSEAFHP